MLTPQQKLDRVSEKLFEMAGLIKALSDAADEVVILAPKTWDVIDAKCPWFQDIEHKAAEFIEKVAYNLQPPEN